jgi:hypothetical protein
MRRAGTEASAALIAQWREVGEWWLDAPGREVTVYIDAGGVRREAIEELGVLGRESGQVPFTETNEDFALRERKIRDEKCSAATGNLPPSYYERNARERWGGGG